MQLAILYWPEAFSTSQKIMGRQSAGVGFLRALAQTRPARLGVYARSRNEAALCAQALADFGAHTGVMHVPLERPELLSTLGVLYRPDPGIHQDCWRRLRRASPSAYSICGITHTLNTHAVLEAISSSVTAPLESWDAVICTSNAGKGVVSRVLDETRRHLVERCRASQFSDPELPVIPLGVHTRDFTPSAEQRARARSLLNIADQEVAILFAGRLVFHGKANPLPMWLALESVAGGRSIVLIQAGVAPNDAIRRTFETECRTVAPSCRHIAIDGRSDELFKAAWSAADIFTSLADNFQETFGLTPIEAMAAGLPVVVSDWDGYKDTVRHGVDGFRIPTLTLPPDAGEDIADRYDLGLDDFDHHSAHTSQFIAVNVEKVAEAYRALIDNPQLRRDMGESGRQRAVEMFDWEVIFQQYQQLWHELDNRRSGASQMPATARRRPDRPDPFSAFSGHPSAAISGKTIMRRLPHCGFEQAILRRGMATIRGATAVLPADEEIREVIDMFREDELRTVESVCFRSHQDRSKLLKTMVWLMKVGVLAEVSN